jgi:hypothetical protein
MHSLPVLKTAGRVLSVKPDANELILLNNGVPVTLVLHTFNQPLQPIQLGVGSIIDEPDGYTDSAGTLQRLRVLAGGVRRRGGSDGSRPCPPVATTATAAIKPPAPDARPSPAVRDRARSARRRPARLPPDQHG